MKICEGETCESFSHCYFLMVAMEKRKKQCCCNLFFSFILIFKIRFFEAENVWIRELVSSTLQSCDKQKKITYVSNHIA